MDNKYDPLQEAMIDNEQFEKDCEEVIERTQEMSQMQSPDEIKDLKAKFAVNVKSDEQKEGQGDQEEGESDDQKEGQSDQEEGESEGVGSHDHDHHSSDPCKEAQRQSNLAMLEKIGKYQKEEKTVAERKEDFFDRFNENNLDTQRE